MKVSFFTPIVNTNHKPNNPCLGNLVESYFDIGQKRYSITEIAGKNIEIRQEKNAKHPPAWITALKVASYLTILLPLIMLALKCVYRFTNHFIEQPSVRIAPLLNVASNSNPHCPVQVAQIKALVAAGKSVRLMYGRTDCDPLPDEGPNVVWVSLFHFSSAQVPPNRIHLWMDFSNYRSFDDLHGLFDTIVIDQSLWSSVFNGVSYNKRKKDYIKTPIELFYALLKPGNSSKLIFESSHQFCASPSNINSLPVYHDNRVEVSINEMLHKRNYPQIKQEAIQRTTAKIKSLFHTVIYHPVSNYPHQYRFPPPQCAYFEAIGPK